MTRKDIQNIESLFMLSVINECKSKRKAAEKIGASVDTLNKYISNLEAELGLKLVESSEKGCVLTANGLNILQNIQQMNSLLLKIYNSSKQDNTVKIGIDTAISSTLAFYNIDNFFCRFPDIKIQSVILQEQPKFKTHNVDIGISYSKPEDKEAVILCSKKIVCKPFAGEKYLQKYGYPTSIDDLIKNHRIVCGVAPVYDDLECQKVFKQASNVCYFSNSCGAITDAVRHDVGICMMPVCLAEKGMICLDNFKWQSSLELFLFSYPHIKDRDCVRAVLNYFKERFAELK